MSMKDAAVKYLVDAISTSDLKNQIIRVYESQTSMIEGDGPIEANARVPFFPQVVPVRVLNWLARAGVHSTYEVHRHIMAGTLQTLPGIGPKRAAKIVEYYTQELTILGHAY